MNPPATIWEKISPWNLRYLFYMVSPNETIYENHDDMPDYYGLVTFWFLVLVVVESCCNCKRVSFSDSITSIVAGISSMLFKIRGRSLSVFLYPIVYSAIHVVSLPLSTSTWIIAFLTQDLAYYLGHRAIHEFGVFWGFHQMHHSSEFYNLSTALRQGAIQDMGMCIFDLLQAFFVPPEIFYPHKTLNVLYQFWIHTEKVPSLGFLEYVINTPSSHRVHHGRNPYAIDRNYGATLIIWDILFGTYAAERKEEQVVYGLVHPSRTFNQWRLQVDVFIHFLAVKMWDKDEEGKELFPGVWNKLKTVFQPPGYYPGTRTRWFFFWTCMEDSEEGIPVIPDSEAARDQAYAPKLTLACKGYILVQFLFLLKSYLDFNETRPALEWGEFLLRMTIILFTIQSFGYFFDKQRCAVPIDLVRLSFIAFVGVLQGNLVMVYISVASAAFLLLIHFTGQLPELNDEDRGLAHAHSE